MTKKDFEKLLLTDDEINQLTCEAGKDYTFKVIECITLEIIKDLKKNPNSKQMRRIDKFFYIAFKFLLFGYYQGLGDYNFILKDELKDF